MFTSLVDGFRPLMHKLLLVWAHSPFYNVPSRLAVLVREMYVLRVFFFISVVAACWY